MDLQTLPSSVTKHSVTNHSCYKITTHARSVVSVSVSLPSGNPTKGGIPRREPLGPAVPKNTNKPFQALTRREAVIQRQFL